MPILVTPENREDIARAIAQLVIRPESKPAPSHQSSPDTDASPKPTGLEQTR